jgi:hypothetical protein
MNFSSVIPQPNIHVNRPVKVSARGNVYKIQIAHHDDSGKPLRNFEVWATKEAIQKHFVGMDENPREYQMRKFARQMYEKQLRNTSATGQMPHSGVFVTTQQTVKGNPNMWPHTITDPEAKF